jgi:pilus assembly protein CpaC
LIDALAQDELIHVLAQPNLTAISGETASFLVGGEFPIPVAQQNNTVTIEFKQFGVSLAFMPTVASDGRITLKVRPEVSQLTNQGAVQLSAGNSTIQVPALTVRRAETTVQLGSGQSFAIAGLLQDVANITGNSVPILGDLPILGALFRSDNFQRNETELVIVVTPYLVRPVSDATALRLPTDGWQPPNDLERILLLRQSARPPTEGETSSLSTRRIPGMAGFVVQ